MLFDVIVTRTTVERATIQIEAKNKEQAKVIAEEDGELFPEYGNIVGIDYEANSVTKSTLHTKKKG